MQPFELDVRPVLRDGGEPFPLIMQAVAALQSGQSLKLLATFRPVPLFQAMQKKGYSYEARKIDEGDWEIIFTPVVSQDVSIEIKPVGLSANAMVPEIWPDPMHYLDCMDLSIDVISEEILDTLNGMEEGAVLFAAMPFESAYLLLLLEQSGHQWVGNFDASGHTYRILIRAGSVASV